MRREKGSALLLAMLTVALVASLSSAAAWHLQRSAQVELAERNRLQADWLLAGALEWARDVLHADARSSRGANRMDHLGEAWSQPLAETNVLEFLSADRQPSDGASLPVAVTAQIVDLQGRMNFRNLVKDGSSATEARALVSAPDLAAFHRLFDLLGLPATELEQTAGRLVGLVNRLKLDENPKGLDLVPQNTEQLGWLGLSATTLAALQPHTTLRPMRSSLNINTASAQALSASVPGLGLGLGEARSLLKARAAAPFSSMADAKERITALRQNPVAERMLGVYSEFFEVHTRVSMSNVLLQERSVLNREDAHLKVIRRAQVLPAAL